MKPLGRLLILPFKLLAAAAETMFAAGRRLGRMLGLRGTLALLAGLGLGLAFAPRPGRELRARLRELLARPTDLSDSELAERVTFELEHAPRTWHLPQPSVTVAQGRVILSGAAPQPAARDELARVAGAVPGVAAVDNLVVVADDTDPADGEAE